NYWFYSPTTFGQVSKRYSAEFVIRATYWPEIPTCTGYFLPAHWLSGPGPAAPSLPLRFSLPVQHYSDAVLLHAPSVLLPMPEEFRLAASVPYSTAGV